MKNLFILGLFCLCLLNSYFTKAQITVMLSQDGQISILGEIENNDIEYGTSGKITRITPQTRRNPNRLEYGTHRGEAGKLTEFKNIEIEYGNSGREAGKIISIGNNSVRYGIAGGETGKVIEIGNIDIDYGNAGNEAGKPHKIRRVNRGGSPRPVINVVIGL